MCEDMCRVIFEKYFDWYRNTLQLDIGFEQRYKLYIGQEIDAEQIFCKKKTCFSVL